MMNSNGIDSVRRDGSMLKIIRLQNMQCPRCDRRNSDDVLVEATQDGTHIFEAELVISGEVVVVGLEGRGLRPMRRIVLRRVTHPHTQARERILHKTNFFYLGQLYLNIQVK